MSGPAIGVAVKWAPRRIDVDPLTGAAHPDERLAGASDADLAALECALVLGDDWGWPVVVATVGPAPAEALLRDALARGASHAVRVEAGQAHEHHPAAGSPQSTALTVSGLMAALGSAPVIICGDYSIDGGSATVPALLAGRRRCAQALGLVSMGPGSAAGRVRAERRLDGGRRERLGLEAPMVLSVEPGAARLRRAGLGAVLAAGASPVEVLRLGDHPLPPSPTRVGPYRPRARPLPGPDPSDGPRQRVLHLVGAADQREPPRRVDAEPAAAAVAIVEQLRRWGYLDEAEPIEASEPVD